MAKSPVLVIHGGAGSKSMDHETYLKYRDSLERILGLAYPILAKSGSALDAVVRATELLEDDPLYNAGKGSKIQSDGKIRMSASLMDGHSRRFSGCVNVEGVKNPIRLAELLLDHEDRVLASAGAKAFAKKAGLPFASPYTARCRADFKARKAGKTGTVGAVALDRKGRLAAATSTGGRGHEYPHRVSDTPTSAGNFATTDCAVSATGTGERIVEHAAASSVCVLMEAGLSLQAAMTRLLKRAKAHKAGFGLIALDRNGRYVADKTTKIMIWGAATAKGVEIFSETSDS